MAIIYHEKSQTFHLFNAEISYVFMVLQNHQLGQLYFGKRIHDREDFSYLLELKDRPMSVCVFEGDLNFSLEHIKQEYPSYGSGDMRYPAFTVAQENGSRISEFVYSGHTIKNGKPELNGLPATYVEQEDEAATLEVNLQDTVSGTELVLRYTIFRDFPVITRNVCFKQNSGTKVFLERAMSLSLDLPDMDYEMIELTGAWARERYVKTRKLEHGIQPVYSMRGCSSAHYNPFIALKRPEATENSGEVIGFSLVYSGNFLAQVEVDTYNVTRVTTGINPENFSWQLRNGESFETPEAVMAYSEDGLNGMSHIFHRLYQSRLARGKWRDLERPILINNWEATYFDFNETKILEIAKCAKQLGIELFVLDDGWFGNRNGDKSSLGDWYVNLEKLPNGISGLANQIEELGMKFGIWIEPEMINKESKLYQEHPDWVLNTPGRRMSHGRNQFVLDFSREDVIEGIYSQLESVFQDAPISYVKWDMNRSMTEVYSQAASPEEQGTIMHKYILGVYK
nr:alpha-galactosidase [Lachnospiraceae bacterium]